MRAGEEEGTGRAARAVTRWLYLSSTLAQLSGAGICRQQEAQSGISGSVQALRKETPGQRVLGVGVFLGRFYFGG